MVESSFDHFYIQPLEEARANEKICRITIKKIIGIFAVLPSRPETYYRTGRNAGKLKAY